MNLGIIAVIVSILFGGTANMLMEKVSKDYEDNYLALVFQYIAMAIAALSLGAIWAIYHGSAYIPVLTGYQWLMVIGVGIIGYIGIALLFKAYDHISGGVALVIANLAVFLMFFLNIALYPGQESFTISKIIIAIVFFVIITQFLLDKGSSSTKHKSFINKYTLYPLGTAVCWSLYFVGNSYFIKSGMMSPVQSGMITETTILFVAVAWFIIMRSKTAIREIKQCMGKDRRAFMLIGFLNIIGVYLTYYGYQTNAANTVNVIKLFTIPVAALMCRIFLKDRLTKKQMLLLIIAFVLMVLFLFA